MLVVRALLVVCALVVPSPEPVSPAPHVQDAVPPVARIVAAAEIAPASPGLLPVPLPALADLEDAVRDQLLEAQQDLRTAIDEAREDAVLLATAYARLGRLYHTYQLGSAAEACYRNASQLAPEDPRWPHALGDLARSEGHLEEAATHYQRTLTLGPDNLAAWVHLGEVEFTLDRIQEAGRALQQALKLDPECAAARALLGRMALSQGDAQRAVQELTAALELAPDANRLHYPLGMAYRELGDLDRAREHLTVSGSVGVSVAGPMVAELQALETGERLHLLRGRRAFTAGRFADAVVSFRRAVEAAPDSRRAHVNLGVALAEAGDPAGGVAQLEQAVALDPGSSDAHYNLGLLLMRIGEPARAGISLEHAVAANPEDIAARLALADLLRGRGDAGQALTHYAAIARTQPSHERARLAEAELLVEAGRYAEARERLDDAHSLMPWQGPLAHALARLLAASPDASLRDGPRALELAKLVHDTTHAPSHAVTVALALAELGRCEEAAQWQREAIAAAEEAGEQDYARTLRPDLARYDAGAPCRPRFE